MTTTLRNSGTDAALAHAGEVWHSMAEYFVYRYLRYVGSTGCLFEEARAFAEGCFMAKPPSPNAWGALALSMSIKGSIEKTGEREQSKTFASNHARDAAMWRIKVGGHVPTL
jgi:hypothetical protein